MDHGAQRAHGRIQSCRQKGSNKQRRVFRRNLARVRGIIDLRAEASGSQRIALTLSCDPRQYAWRVRHRAAKEVVLRSEAREDHFGISEQRIASVIVDTESLHKNREWKYFCDV